MSTLKFEIQQAQPGDWRRIRDIRLRSLAEAPDAFSTTLAQDAARSDDEWRGRIEQSDVAHFLAATNEGDVGIAVGAPYADYENTAGLFGMWVTPGARGQKVGTALVQTVLNYARERKYKRIVLDVADANTAAVRLYESCGFIATGNTSTLAPPRERITEHERAVNLG